MNIARRMQYYHHYTRAELTAFVLDASKELLAESQRITPTNLRTKGVRGSGRRLAEIRNELVASGAAAARGCCAALCVTRSACHPQIDRVCPAPRRSTAKTKTRPG